MSSAEIPTGVSMPKLLWKQEDACNAKSVEALQAGECGELAPRCIETLGAVLSLLDRVSSCFWVCNGGSHVRERLTGRAVSAGSVSSRLLLLGCYDESLAISRSIGEIANLLFLFALDERAHDTWAALQQKRWDHFSPGRVREKLRKLDAPILVDTNVYSPLSQLVHSTSSDGPQTYNPFGMPLRAAFQPAGLLIALNELSREIAGVGMAIHRIVGIPPDESKWLVENAEVLGSCIGQACIDKIGEYWALIRSHPKFADLQAKVYRAFNQRAKS